jgi:hypothetical protein
MRRKEMDVRGITENDKATLWQSEIPSEERQSRVMIVKDHKRKIMLEKRA